MSGIADPKLRLSLFSTVLDNMSEGVCVYDKSGNFVYVNNHVTRIRNISKEEYYRLNVHKLYNKQYFNICIFDMVMAQKKEVDAVQVFVKQGHREERLTTGLPIFDEYGNVEYVMVLLRDVRHFQEQYHEALKKDLIFERIMEPSMPVLPVAESDEMKDLFSLAKNIAMTDSSVCLCGESGVGKEVVVEYIHAHSLRRAKQMVVINCAALPEALLESELFGYEKGTFTGGLQSGKVGLIESANKSTLFLDEINSLPLSLQGKLLRVLETKSVIPVGGIKNRSVDFRLITATNVNLAEMVERGEFRVDLYYRLNVVPIYIPPLRERRADILPLCERFIAYFSEKYGLEKEFSKPVLAAILQYNWPGNVRELRNFVERLLVMTPPAVHTIRSLPAGLLSQDGTMSAIQNISTSKPALDYATIVEALARNNGHRAHTAQYLGISRRTLQYKLKELGIVADDTGTKPET